LKKLLLLVLLASIGGFIYAPYQATEKFATAAAQRDLDALGALTDITKLRESFKTVVRPALSDTLKQRLPSNYPAQRGRSEVLAAIVLYEKQIDLLFTDDNVGRIFDLLHSPKVRGPYQMTSKGWRGPLTFVAVDSNDGTKMIFEFQGLAGWRLTGFDASRNVTSGIVNYIIDGGRR
jgi:Protein of unknown function (DUF2939)